MSTNLLLVSPYNVNFYGGVQNQVKLFKDGLDKTNFNYDANSLYSKELRGAESVIINLSNAG